MGHRIPIAAISIGVLLIAASEARLDALASTGRVHGFVRDGAGAGVADASVLAVGRTVIASRSDAQGRFQMSVPPGEYVLRASRNGYVSNYRESVRVHSSVPLERTITLVRQEQPLAANRPDDHSHSTLAWRLRHLPRSVLRDGTAVLPQAERTNRSLFGQLTGEVNFVTTTTANLAAVSTTFPRSVAYVVFGAPVGRLGDWRVRGAVASGSRAAWNFLGEYEAPRSAPHALRFGVSYSAHGPKVQTAGLWQRAVLEARSVAGIFAEDHWRPLPDLDVQYSVRADRYDFLSTPYLISASGSMRTGVTKSMFVTARAGRSMVAPGAEEFLPPPADGPWLPPERTFAALPRDQMRAEDVRHAEIGLTREFGSRTGAHAVHVRAFAQETVNQIVTLFGTGAGVEQGSYHVARAGLVELTGWSTGIRTTIRGSLTGQVEYSRLSADWHGVGRTRSLRRIAPSVVRDARELLHDITASVEARMNQARTRLRFVYRSNTAFSTDDGGAVPEGGSRFDFQLHQALPYRPVGDSHVELMFAIRTLLRDPREGASVYDELLTVAPPLRLLGGIQVRF